MAVDEGLAERMRVALTGAGAVRVICCNFSVP